MAEEFLKLYPAATDEQAQASRLANSLAESLVSMYLWARKRAATTQTKTYIYLWDHTMPGPDSQRYGAFHIDDDKRLFGLTIVHRHRPTASQKGHVLTCDIS